MARAFFAKVSLASRPTLWIWLFISLAYVWMFALLVLKAIVFEPAAVDVRWAVRLAARHDAGLRGACACVIQTAGLACAAAYGNAKQRPAVLAAALYCLLGVLTFSLDAYDLLWHPYGLELGYFAFAAASGAVVFNVLVAVAALRKGRQGVMRTASRPVFWLPPVWFLFWPLPHFALKLQPQESGVPVGSLLAFGTVGLFGAAGAVAVVKTYKFMRLHWTVLATGAVFWLAWATSDVLHILVAAGYSSVTADTAHHSIHAMILAEVVQIGVSVTKAIISHEESSRLRAQRDAAQAESASRKEQLLQAKQGDEARQKFLRYVFHEIRVPFNSIDMGLNMLLEDVQKWESEHKMVLLPASTSVRRQSSAPALLSQAQHAPYDADEQQGVLQLPLQAKDTIETLSKAAASMKVIINDTLDWTKLQSGAFKIRLGPCNMHAVVQESLQGLQAFARHNRVQVLHHVDRLVEQYLLADSVRLQQVVANFVSNAIKFAPSDGSGVVTITITVNDDQADLNAQPEVSSTRKAEAEHARGLHPTPFSLDSIWWKEVPTAAPAPSPSPAPPSQLMGSTGSSTLSPPASVTMASHSKPTALTIPPPPLSVRAEDLATPRPISRSLSSRQRRVRQEPSPFLRQVEVTPNNICTDNAAGTACEGVAAGLPSFLPPVIGPAVAARLQDEGLRPAPLPVSGSLAGTLVLPARQRSTRLSYDGQQESGVGSSLFHVRGQHGVAGLSPSASDVQGCDKRASVWADSANTEQPRLQTIIISVKDNGEGVSAEEAPVLFSAFRQLDAGMQYKGKGTGLGLAICYEIVTLHGGRVGVRSSGKKGEGAEFLVALRLPVLEEQVGANAQSVDKILATSANEAKSYVEDTGTAEKAFESHRHTTTIPTHTGQRPPLPHLALGSSSRVGSSRPTITTEVTDESARTATTGHGADPRAYCPSSHCALEVDAAPNPVGSSLLRLHSGRPSHDVLPVHSSPLIEGAGGGQGRHSPRKLRLLIVDDVSDNRKLLRRALTRALCSDVSKHAISIAIDVDEAEDGHIAVEMVSQRGAHYYDVITMDAEMPTMSGFIATEKIRQLGYTGLLYGCTGNALQEDQELFTRNGANEVFIKPVHVAVLSSRIVKQITLV